MVKLAVKLPQYPEGEEIAIAGLGRFVNGGEAVEVDEDALAAYEQEQGKSIQEALKNNPGVTVDGTEGKTYEAPKNEESSSTTSTTSPPWGNTNESPDEGSEE